jgi:hypothetical protein
MTRLTLGGAFAPLVPVLFLVLLFWVYPIGRDRYGLPSYFYAQDLALQQFSVLGYMVLALGMWPYRWLRRRGRVGAWRFVLAGLALGPVAALYFPLVDIWMPTLRDGAPISAMTPVYFLAASMMIGCATTAAFWFIGRPDLFEAARDRV